jgi:four helix bundle protein
MLGSVAATDDNNLQKATGATSMSDQRRGQNICDRTFAFAVRIVKLCRYLNKQPDIDKVLIKQLSRSGTSIGANVEEAQAGQSDLDFISKYAIALKEARETSYWLRLLVAAECVQADRVDNLIREASEIMRILAAIIISAKRRQK